METDFICMHNGSRKEPIFTKMYNINDKQRISIRDGFMMCSIRWIPG